MSQIPKRESQASCAFAFSTFNPENPIFSIQRGHSPGKTGSGHFLASFTQTTKVDSIGIRYFPMSQHRFGAIPSGAGGGWGPPKGPGNSSATYQPGRCDESWAGWIRLAGD